MIAKIWKSERPSARSKPPVERDSAALKKALSAALARRDHARALELIARLEALEPGDPRWPHKCGDLLRREGRVRDAASAYRRAAERYEGQGFDTRSRAIRHLARSLTAESQHLSPLHPSLVPDPSRAHG
jgi:predicted Zn-dependent protease